MNNDSWAKPKFDIKKWLKRYEESESNEGGYEGFPNTTEFICQACNKQQFMSKNNKVYFKNLIDRRPFCKFCIKKIRETENSS